jgi:hypothetical protein
MSWARTFPETSRIVALVLGFIFHQFEKKAGRGFIEYSSPRHIPVSHRE